MKKHSLAWADEFIARIRPYVFMRLTDNVLIRMPNEAFKLNPTGARVIAHMLDGGSVLDIIRARADEAGGAETEAQLERFFNDFSLMWNNKICENYSTAAIHRSEFSLGYIKLPVLSEIALTYDCNIRCRFCYAGCSEPEKQAGQPTQPGLDVKGFMKVLDSIRFEAEVPSVSFTGGEPTLYKELPSLISYAVNNNGMRVNLITNGTLITARKAKALARAGLSSAQVSIESASADEHDAITGVTGSHAASINGLKALQAAGIRVHPHVTICSLNRAKLLEYPVFCQGLGLDRFSANLIIPAGRGEDVELMVSYSEIGEIVTTLQASAAEAGIEFMWYSPTPICLFNPLSKGLGNKGCSACEGLLSIDPAGNVLPCSSWPEPVGNLLEEGFESLWFKQRSEGIRNKLDAPDSCRICEHFAVCQGACPLYFKVHGCGELEKSWSDLGLQDLGLQ